MNHNEFRNFGHELVDWMADYLDGVRDYPVRSQARPGEIRAQIGPSAPEHGESMAEILNDFRAVVVPGMTHWQHPRFFAYFPANSSPPSVLAEMLTATLGAQCMSWDTSPAATELEQRMMEWLREMMGLPETFVGSIQDTASTATLVAVVTARERSLDWTGNSRGGEATANSTVYCSTETHSSVEKAVKIAGIGTEFLRKIPVDDGAAMIPDALDAQITDDRNRGLRPVCVVACLGTTGTSGIDSLRAIGPICRNHDAWLHVDAAWAGSALVLPETRWMIDGIEHADSFVFNPHKWMFTNFDCSVFYVRDVRALTKTFEMHPEYLRTAHSDAVVNYRDWGIQLGRRFRALKLWFVLRSYGVRGIQEHIRNHIGWARELADQIDQAHDFTLMTQPVLSLFCFRYTPSGRSQDDLDVLNEQLLQAVNATGELYVTHTRVDGRYVIRFVVGQTQTTREDVQGAWLKIQEVAAGL